ncbi:MAG TPA: gluconate 2-dehydrogenase subunit 3 family protein [Candidatus Didemnitutus sp.]|nr:gluconate 2-dehydrogenase subunit 3 family protein [Candidatus Didemnitutus sp.]
MSTPEFPRVDRRTAVKWMLTAAAGAVALGRTPLGWAANARAAEPSGKGYGTDPDLTKDYKPGDLWPLTLSDSQRRTAAALCGFIIPADSESPSAASLGVHDFIDEWISAPYPDQQRDRPAILDGLAWIDAEAKKRFGKGFADLDEKQMAAIGDDICHVPDAKPEFADAAKFFARFRDLTAGGFYTTPAGMKDLKYIGNVPLAEFKGPPPEVLKLLGLS